MIAVGAVAIVSNIVNIIPAVEGYNPVSLLGASMQLLTDNAVMGEVYSMLAVAGVGIVGLTLAAVACFNRKRA